MASRVFHKDYFIKVSRKYGIQKINSAKTDSDSGKEITSVLTDSEDDFRNILDQCKILYNNLKTGFSLKINKDHQDHYTITIL